MAPRTRPQMHRFRAVIALDGGQLFSDFTQRIVPRHALPLARSSLAIAPHRIFEPVGMIDQFLRRIADGAKTPTAERAFRIALHFDQGVVGDMQKDAATTVTTAADAFQDLYILRGG